MGNIEKQWIFSETIAASDMKGSKRRHLNEYMKICEY